MRRQILAGTLMATLILSACFIGCGDDDKSTTPGGQQNLNDPSYTVASLVLDASDATVEFAYLVTIIDFWQIKWNSDIRPVYHPASGFWYSEEVHLDTIYSDVNPSVIINTTRQLTRDSIRFWHGTSPVQNPDSALLTRIESGVYLRLAADSTTDSVVSRHSLNITGAPGAIWNDSGDVTIGGIGTVYSAVTSEASTDPEDLDLDSLGVCAIQWTVTSNYPALAFNLDDLLFGCPTGGSITSTGPIDVDYCPGAEENLEFPGTWSSVRTFNGQNITIVTNSPTRQWTRNRICGDQ